MVRFENLEIPGLAVLVSELLLGIHFLSAVENHHPETFQRGGAIVILIGIVLTGVAYLKPASIEQQAASRLPPLAGSSYGGPRTNEHNRRRELLRPAARTAVLTERYVAFALIIVGTFINGYGDWLLGARF